MAETPSLGISRGPNRGEAAFLGESSFDPIRMSENIVRQEQQKRLQNKQQGEQQLQALLSDDFKAKWDIDKLNYFDPKIKAFRDEVISAFRANNGRLTPEQRILLENQKKSIEEEVLLSNTVQQSYINQVNKLKGSKGEFDEVASEENLRTFADPKSNPETAKELQEVYGGDVFKWRADNAMKYGLVPSFSFDKYTDEIMKGENLSELPIQDATGKVVTEQLPGGDYLYRVEKKLSPEQAKTLASRVWNETNAQSSKAKDMAYSAVDQSFSIDESGNVSFGMGGAISDEDSDKILEYAGSLAGLSKDEARRRLAQGYLATTFERKSDKGVMTRKSRAIPQPRTSRGGGGGSTDEVFLTGQGQNELSFSAEVKNDKGEWVQSTPEKRTVTYPNGMNFKPAKATLPASPNLVSTKDNRRLTKTDVTDIEYGQAVIVPVFLSGERAGKVIPDTMLEEQKKNGNVKYSVYTFGNGTERTRDGKSNSITVYRPASEAISAIKQNLPAAYRQSLQQNYDKLVAEAEELNKSLKPKTKTQAKAKKPATKPTYDPNDPL